MVEDKVKIEYIKILSILRLAKNLYCTTSLKCIGKWPQP